MKWLHYRLCSFQSSYTLPTTKSRRIFSSQFKTTVFYSVFNPHYYIDNLTPLPISIYYGDMEIHAIPRMDSKSGYTDNCALL